jgi:uncharacterized protein (TIGR02145 family)
VTGTPSSIGTASFALSIGGQSCNLAVTVSAPVCRAKVTSTDYKVFMCYNLGAANTSADPFTPSWEINGGYWQWGRAAEATTGPTGPGAGDANEGAITGWNTTNAADGSWTDASKTANDPCPSGFRVPTKAHWDGVKANNTLTNVGSNWTAGPTNYSTGKKIGGELMLPATGNRDFFTGSLGGRGSSGYYWSSTQSASTKGWDLDFETSNTNSDSNFRTNGFPVRCIAE